MFCRRRKWGLLLGLAIGLPAGLALSGWWPNTPLHAVATDRYETFAIATGWVDSEVEAVYFLDFLTGDLSAVVVGRSGAAFMVTGHYGRNVLQDLNVDVAKNPRFLMVTGMADLSRGGRGGPLQPSRAVVYVAEVTTGRAAAYGIPWNATAHARGQFVRQALVPVCVFPFRAAPAAAGNAPEKQ